MSLNGDLNALPKSLTGQELYKILQDKTDDTELLPKENQYFIKHSETRQQNPKTSFKSFLSRSLSKIKNYMVDEQENGLSNLQSISRIFKSDSKEQLLSDTESLKELCKELNVPTVSKNQSSAKQILSINGYFVKPFNNSQLNRNMF